MNKWKFYLAGAICNEKDPHSWRDDLKEFLRCEGHTYIDPTDIVNLEPVLKELRERKQENLIRIIMNEWILIRDKEAVLKCDAIIAYVPYYSVGTLREITLAHENKKPVYIVTDMDQSKISNSLIGLSTAIFHDFEELKEFIEQFR
ncbi:TPA_asm: hypothetical protein vir520_00003 [Caudoviricetes sp. vir520]|nr:TPA_asm: hypothetical protein vir520_00003 [Caudoviricetes sp. vir520]